MCYIAECGCPEQIVALRDSKATFKNLSHTKLYFPMICRSHANAFYGVAPPLKAIHPRLEMPVAKQVASLQEVIVLTELTFICFSASKVDEGPRDTQSCANKSLLEARAEIKTLQTAFKELESRYLKSKDELTSTTVS